MSHNILPNNLMLTRILIICYDKRQTCEKQWEKPQLQAKY